MQYSSHSCKRTLLHWAAVANLSLDSRRLLGGHVLSTDAWWLAYSVDGLVGPIQEMKKVLTLVSEQRLEVLGEDVALAPDPEKQHPQPQECQEHTSEGDFQWRGD
eukprot:1806673-Amphidinium_carterae.1